VDPNKHLVKGGGGALLREKMIEARAKKLVIIVDTSKRYFLKRNSRSLSREHMI